MALSIHKIICTETAKQLPKMSLKVRQINLITYLLDHKQNKLKMNPEFRSRTVDPWMKDREIVSHSLRIKGVNSNLLTNPAAW